MTYPELAVCSSCATALAFDEHPTVELAHDNGMGPLAPGEDCDCEVCGARAIMWAHIRGRADD